MVRDSASNGEVITREELYALVWSQPLTTVCKRFDVSSSYMAGLHPAERSAPVPGPLAEAGGAARYDPD